MQWTGHVPRAILYLTDEHYPGLLTGVSCRVRDYRHGGDDQSIMSLSSRQIASLCSMLPNGGGNSRIRDRRNVAQTRRVVINDHTEQNYLDAASPVGTVIITYHMTGATSTFLEERLLPKRVLQIYHEEVCPNAGCIYYRRPGRGAHHRQSSLRQCRHAAADGRIDER